MGWTMFFLFVGLKVPILLAAWLIWWAVRAVPDPAAEDDARDDGGSDRPPRPQAPKPRPSRRGPHGDPALPAPARVRAPVRARARERLS